MATTNRIAVAARWSEKYFFPPNLPKSCGEQEENGEN